MFKRIFLVATFAVAMPLSLATAAEPVPAELAADAEKLVGHMESLAALVVKNADSCDAMASAIDGYTESHGKELGALTARVEAATAEQSEALRKRFDDRTRAAGVNMVEGLVKCAGHAGVEAAFSRLEGEGKGKARVEATIDDADVEKLVAHMEALGKVMSDNLADCGKMASGIDAFAMRNRDEIALLSERMSALSAEQQLMVESRYRDRLEHAISAVMQGVTACGADPAVEAAMRKLEL